MSSNASGAVCALPECHKPCFKDRGGFVHDYCGRSHAEEMRLRRHGAGAGRQHGACQLAGCSDSASFDGKRNCWHDFCSRSHASAAIASGQQWVRGGGGKGASTCKFLGCQKGEFVDPTTGQGTGYCSKSHAKAMGSAANTTAVGPHVDRVISGGTTSATDFRLYSLSKTHPDCLSLLAQFNSKTGGSGPNTLQRVFKVQVPADVHRRAAAYKRTTGNVKRRFHGTGCSARCSFFADPKGRPCGGKECNVCSICTHGFLLKGTGGLFGKGLYFSSQPDKANAYAQASQKTGSEGKKLRCMFVANVSAGSAFVTNQGSLPSNMCPPPNYDSVVGSGLGHDELVVYKAEAALPTYLIVYSLP